MEYDFGMKIWGQININFIFYVIKMLIKCLLKTFYPKNAEIRLFLLI